MRNPDLFARSKAEYIAEAQKVARDLLMRQENITIEHVTQLCPLPRYLHKNLLGKVFQHPIFRPIGYTVARRPEARGHVIRIWTLRQEFFDRQALKKRSWAMERDSGR